MTATSWYTAHQSKITQARELTTQGNFLAAFRALDEAEAIRQGRESELREASRPVGLLHPQKVNTALEALDFSLPEQAELGIEILWVANYLGALRVYQATLEEGNHVQ